MNTMKSRLLRFIYCSMMLAGGVAHAAPLGTLFYSPAEREALVSSRCETAPSAVYTVSGIIKRGPGKSAAWINGREVTEVPPDPAIPSLVIKNGYVLIEGKPIKVGETLDIVSGQRVLRLPEHSVQVKP